MTKRDELIALDPAGLEAAVRECARITAPEISDVEYERIKADNSPRYQNTRAEMERTLRAYLNAARSQPNVQPALEAPAAGSNFDGYDVRFHENVLGQLGATTKSDGTASAEGRVQGPDPSVGKTRDILQNRAGVASGPSDTKSASPFLSTLPSGECGPSVTTPEGEVDAPVAFITKSALEKFMKGSEPEQHVLLHRGNDLRAGLYTHPAPSDGAIREGGRMDDSPAFPVLDNPGDGSLYCRSGGMLLRDYFAAHIAAGMAAFSGTAGVAYGPDDIAGRSYQIADAMLRCRSKPDGR